MTAFEILCKILASEVMGKNNLAEVEKELNESNAEELYSIAKTFDMAHLCGSAFKKMSLDISEEILAPFYNEFTLAVFRNRRLIDELSQISGVFEDGGIEHIALKGSVIRGYYPESWMRTSCDIDILVKKEQLQAASVLLEEKLGYKYLTRCSHDISFESKTGVHLELHFTLLEDFSSLSGQSEVISDVWEASPLKEGKSYTREMTDAYLYFYNLAHMAKHFLSGGCGVKPFVDLWVLENRIDFNREERERLVSKGGLGAFLEASRNLVEIWFFGKARTEKDRIFEKYIVSGGVYGTVENKVKVGTAKKKSRVRYILGRIFPSYTTLKNQYPVLEKRKILLPICYIRRWFRILLRGRIKRATFEISRGAAIDKDEINDVSSLLKTFGFEDKNSQKAN